MITYHPESDEAAALATTLKLHLPYSLPLLYRLKSSRGSNALVYDSRDQSFNIKRSREAIFTLAIVDRSQWPMTEAWLFSSAQQFLDSKTSNITSGVLTEEINAIKETTRLQLHTLLVAVYRKGTVKRNKDGNVPPLLIGSVPDCLVDLICYPAYPSRLVPSPYRELPLPAWRKYFIPLPCKVQTKRRVELQGLILCPVKPQHIPLVQANSPFPRERETLMKLHSMAAYPTNVVDSEPVAWAYLSLDGSLQSLHVEPSHRCQGLGQHISSALLNSQIHHFELAHADVAGDNLGSVRIFENLGGEWTYQIYWIHLDLSALPAVS